MKKYKVVFQWKYPADKARPDMKDIPWIPAEKRKEWGWGPRRDVKARNLRKCQARKLVKYLTQVEDEEIYGEDEELKYVFLIEEM